MKKYYFFLMMLFATNSILAQTTCVVDGITITVTGTLNSTYLTPTSPSNRGCPTHAYTGNGSWTGFGSTGTVTYSFDQPIISAHISYTAVNYNDVGKLSVDTGGNLTISNTCNLIDLGNNDIQGDFNDFNFGDVELKINSTIPFNSITIVNIGGNSGWLQGNPCSFTLTRLIDTDEDGIPDDSDNDGIPDSAEGTGDTDGDGIPNYLDLDSDNDGILDVDEGGNGDQDTNNDGVIDSNDTGYADTNMDGQADGSVDTNEEPDTDGDGIPDYQDLDSDNDGINDTIEGGNDAADTNGDGIIDSNDTGGGDADGDGIPDSVDGNSGTFGDSGDPDHQDSDGDGIPDSQDLDSDDDGILDIVEGNNVDADTNGDGVINGDDTNGNDTDGDGIPDSVDENSGSYGDAGNDDNPANNTSDPTNPNSGGSGTVGDSGTDNDGDGIADSVDDCDNGEGTPEFGVCDATLSLDDVVIKNGDDFIIYPNPVKGELTIQFGTNVNEVNVSVYNIAGQLIDQKTPNIIENKARLDLSQISSGVYLTTIVTNKGLTTKRLLIE